MLGGTEPGHEEPRRQEKPSVGENVPLLAGRPGDPALKTAGVFSHGPAVHSDRGPVSTGRGVKHLRASRLSLDLQTPERPTPVQGPGVVP